MVSFSLPFIFCASYCRPGQPSYRDHGGRFIARSAELAFQGLVIMSVCANLGDSIFRFARWHEAHGSNYRERDP